MGFVPARPLLAHERSAPKTSAAHCSCDEPRNITRWRKKNGKWPPCTQNIATVFFARNFANSRPTCVYFQHNVLTMHETCTSRFALVTQGQRDQHRSSVSLQHCLVIPGIFSDMVNGATLCTCIMVTGRYRDASNRVPSNDFPLATTSRICITGS